MGKTRRCERRFDAPAPVLARTSRANCFTLPSACGASLTSYHGSAAPSSLSRRPLLLAARYRAFSSRQVTRGLADLQGIARLRRGPAPTGGTGRRDPGDPDPWGLHPRRFHRRRLRTRGGGAATDDGQPAGSLSLALAFEISARLALQTGDFLRRGVTRPGIPRRGIQGPRRPTCAPGKQQSTRDQKDWLHQFHKSV